MHDTELEQHLKKHYQSRFGKPPAVETIWEQVAPQLQTRKANIPWWQHIFTMSRTPVEQVKATPKTYPIYKPVRLASMIAAMVMLTLLIVATTASAATGGGPLQGLFDILGIRPITAQFSDYHQSKSIDGYTITINRAYADTNRVLIQFTIKVPAGNNTNTKFAIGESKLITDQGINLQAMEGAATFLEGLDNNMLSFDAHSIQGTPGELHLHLAVPYGSQLSTGAFHSAGSLKFDFTVPFHPGKVVSVNQTVVAAGTPKTVQITTKVQGKLVKSSIKTLNGQAVTLQNVIITPSEVRVKIKGLAFSTIFGAGQGADINFALTVTGKTYTPAMWGEIPGTDICQISYFDTPLSNKTGVWTLTIQQGANQVDPATGKTGFAPVPGGAIWLFQFTVK